MAIGLILWLSNNSNVKVTSGFEYPNKQELILRSKTVNKSMCSFCRDICRRNNDCCEERPRICYNVEFKFYNDDEYICSYIKQQKKFPSEINSYDLNQTYQVILDDRTKLCEIEIDKYIEYWIAGLVFICLTILSTVLFVVLIIYCCVSNKKCM